MDKELVEGRETFLHHVAKLLSDEINELDIIKHGYVASVHGTVIGNKRSYDFCHVYRFTGATKTAKVKEITSYLIPRKG